MAKRDKTSVTIDQVRAAAELVAKKTDRAIEEVTVAQVAEILGEGSDGYLGAHLQTVKLEFVRAKRLDTSSLTPLLSALRYELDRACNNGLETGRAESRVTQDLFNEICDRNIALEGRAMDLEQQLAASESERKAEKLDRDNDRQKIQALTSNIANLQGVVADTSKQLNDANFQLGNKTAQINELETIVSKTDKVIGDLKQSLSDANIRLETAVGEARDHKQRADLLSMRNEDLRGFNADQAAKLDAANKRAATAEAQLAVINSSKTPKNGRVSPGSKKQQAEKKPHAAEPVIIKQ